jgi:hypothetical protein
MGRQRQMTLTAELAVMAWGLLKKPVLRKIYPVARLACDMPSADGRVRTTVDFHKSNKSRARLSTVRIAAASRFRFTAAACG